MIKRLIIFSILLGWNHLIFADTLTIISGTNVSYANEIIKIESYKDLITKKTQTIATDTVDSLGNFNFELIIAETQLIQMPLGIYNAILYVEPGKSYDLALPPIQKRTKANILNPYFKPVEIYLGVKNPDSLDVNLLIAEFNEKYHRFIDQHYYAIIKNPRTHIVDSLINSLEEEFYSVEHDFFKNYRNYKYAWLKYISIMRDTRYIARDYFNDKPILYNNPAYMDLFNQVFSQYLNFYSNTKEGQRIYSDIALAKSPTFAKQTFSNNLAVLNDTLQELVLLKGLHDAFYTKDFPNKSLLITLDSVKIDPEINYHSKISENIREKVLQAKAGYPAPDFALFDSDSVLRKKNEYLSNYVYLNFISIDSYSCTEDLKLVKQLYEKHKNDFKVISISIDEDFNEVKTYFQENEYNWILLDASNNIDVIDQYKVRAYPTYYLIDTDGKLVFSPAAGPAENFEWYFFTMLKNKERNQHRK